MAVPLFKAGETTWAEFWKARLSAPVLAELRFDIKSLADLNIEDDTFSARFLLYVKVPRAALYDDRCERQLQPGSAFVTASDGRKIEEWMPWLEFDGTIKSKWVWARDSGRAIVFCYEVDGVFETKNSRTGGLFPFDFHTLPIKVSSNWDASRLRFAPFESRWTAEVSEATLLQPVSVVDPVCARFRNSVGHRTLMHAWVSSEVPRLTISSSDGFTGQYVYSQADASLFVRRRISFHSSFELVRPFALAILAPISLPFVSAQEDRLNLIVSLIVSLSFSFLNVKMKRISFADFYRLASLIYLSVMLVAAIAPNDLPEFVLELGAWGLFGIWHAAFLLRLLAAYPERWKEWTAHRDSRQNSIEYLLKDVRRGIFSFVGAGGKSGGKQGKDAKAPKVLTLQSFGHRENHDED